MVNVGNNQNSYSNWYKEIARLIHCIILIHHIVSVSIDIQIIICDWICVLARFVFQFEILNSDAPILIPVSVFYGINFVLIICKFWYYTDTWKDRHILIEQSTYSNSTITLMKQSNRIVPVISSL